MRRRDIGLRDEAQEFDGLLQGSGVAALQERFREEAKSNGVDKVFLLLLSPRLEILAASDLTGWKGLHYDAIARMHRASRPEAFRTVSAPGHVHKVRVLTRRTANGAILELGESLKEDDELMTRFRGIFGTVSAAMLLLGSLWGWWLARRAMSGIKRITRTTTRIAKGDLTRRVPVGGEGEEIDHLAMAFNHMLEQIDSLVAELREVTNNIAHDLRSPITSIRGIAETTLTGSKQGPDEYRAMAGMIVEECDRLVGMINTMLEIAAMDSGAAPVSRAPVDVLEIVRNAHDLFQPVAEDKGVHLQVTDQAGPLLTLGAVDRLQRVVANLLDNAIKYTPAGGKVVLAAKGTPAQVLVSVIDSGVGIKPEDLPRIFTRFYRGDRSRSTPGNGLGLSLAYAIVRAHGGDIRVTSSPDQGSTFSVLLPRLFTPPLPNITKM
jgi:signal transduction histidine kinase